MSADEVTLPPPAAPAYYRGRALPVLAVSAAGAAAGAAAAEAQVESARLFSSRCSIGESVDTVWDRRKTSTQADVDAALRRARHAAPPPAACAPAFVAAVAASSPIVTPRPPPSPAASVQRGQPWRQTVMAGSWSARPASASASSRLSSRTHSRPPSPLSASAAQSGAQPQQQPGALTADTNYRKPAQPLASTSLIPSSHANTRSNSTTTACPPRTGQASAARPLSARTAAPQSSRSTGARFEQNTPRTSAYANTAVVAVEALPPSPVSAAARAAEAQRRSSARLASPSPPREIEARSAVAAAPAGALSRRPASARSSVHRGNGGEWQRPQSATHNRRSLVAAREVVPVAETPLSAHDETRMTSADAENSEHAGVQVRLVEMFPASQLPVRSVSDSSAAASASASASTLTAAATAVAAHPLTARPGTAAGSPSPYFTAAAAAAAMSSMPLRLPPSGTAASAANTARLKRETGPGACSSRGASTERAGGGRLCTGSVSSAANTARGSGSLSRRGDGTARSTASSLWPPSTIPSARYGPDDYQYSDATPQDHSAHPLSALSGPAPPLLPSGEAPPALLESLRVELHRASKCNDIEAALLCVQKLQLFRVRHSADHASQRSHAPGQSAGPFYGDGGSASTGGELGPVWDVRLLCDRNGSTALFHAAWEGHTAMARLLLCSGVHVCPVSHRNVRGNSALDMAVERSNLGVVRLLLARGAKLSSASPHMAAALSGDACAPLAGAAAAAADANADPGPASGPADLRRLEVLGARATYEISPRVADLMRTRASTPHKALKLAYYIRAGAVSRLAALFQSNPRGAARWSQHLQVGGMTALGLAAYFGHGAVAHLLLERGGVDVHALCAVRGDGRLLEEGGDDEEGGEGEEGSDSDAESDDDDESENGSLGPFPRRTRARTRSRTRTTNAFALAVEHGHYLLALELHERWGARIDFSPELRAAVEKANAAAAAGVGGDEQSAAPSASAAASVIVRSSLLLMQRMADLSLELQHRLIEIKSSHHCGPSDPLESVQSWLEGECGPGVEGSRLRGGVVSYPDQHGRCALHVAVALEMPSALEYLLEQGGFRASAGPLSAPRAGTGTAASPSDALSEGREHLREMTLLQLAMETNNLTLVYLLLAHGGRLSVAAAIRALDRKTLPHSRLSEANGLLLISYAMEQARNAAREERARRDHDHAIACAVALARGEPAPPLPPLLCAVMGPDDLVALLNSTSIGVELAQRILQTLLPAMQADAAESGSAQPDLDVSACLRRLHAWQLAQGRAVRSAEDEAAAGASSGYGQAHTGLESARGAASARNGRRRKNRLHDPAYLARLLARQRAHAARHALLWSEVQGSPEEQRAEAADRSALRRMEGAMLTPQRIQQLLLLHAQLVSARADAVPVPLTEADKLMAESARLDGLHRDDMMGERAERHRAQVRAAKAAARADAEAALAPQPLQAVALTDTGAVDWAALSRRTPASLLSAPSQTENAQALRSRRCFQMDELLEYNPRLRLGLGVDAGGDAGSVLVPSSIPGGGVAPRRIAARTHSGESWVRAWQSQAWDEGLHSIDVLLREFGRRRDRAVKRSDWLPLAFLWPNRYSQEQAVRAAARRSARSIRVAERQARRARLVAGKDSAAAVAASAAVAAAVDAQAAGAAATSDFVNGAVGKILLGGHSTAGSVDRGGRGDFAPSVAQSELGGAGGPSVSPEAAALALRMHEDLAAQFGFSSSPWNPQPDSAASPSRTGGGAGADTPGPVPSLLSLMTPRSAPPAASLLYSPRMLAMAQAAEIIEQQQALMRHTEIDTPAWLRSR